MYRITIYNNDNEKEVNEMKDEDRAREIITQCTDDVEAGRIKSFVVSRIVPSFYQKPFWEE